MERPTNYRNISDIIEDSFVNKTINLLKAFPQVDCITLGGSRATDSYDGNSDYDIYIYLNQPIDIKNRHKILSTTCSYLEVNNQYWETEDDCILNNGVPIEIIYRNINDMNKSMENILENHTASCGYSTCLCYNFFQSIILYDPEKKYENLLRNYNFDFPEALRRNIIQKNRELLEGKIPSYDKQIAKAIERKDIVSVHHRITEFLASYFDILFAINRMYHPGEKRLVEYCMSHCDILPKDFEDNVTLLLSSSEMDTIQQAVKHLINGIDHIMRESGSV